MNGLFSNRYCLQKNAIAALLLLGLCTHTHILGNQYGHKKLIILEQCLNNTAPCVGDPLVMRVRIEQSPDGPFIAYPRIRGVYQLRNPVLLSGDLAGIQHGYVIDILGAYSPDSTFSVTKTQRDDWVRPVKYIVSILGLILTAILLSRRYRFSSSRLFPLISR
jgi:hypothetical protein